MSQADVYANPAAAVATPATGAAGAGSATRGAIARAAQATGVDFSYLLAQARLESSLDPAAHAATSSAAGLYQFTRGTWSTMLARHGDALGLGAGGGAIGSGAAAAAAPSSRAALMALRYDPETAARMAAEFAADNTAALTPALGRAPTSSELYLAHFLGSAGATRFLAALAADPGQSAAALLPRPAAANRAIFFDASGAPRSLGQVMTLIDGKMATALDTTDDFAPAGAGNLWPKDAGPDPAMAATAAIGAWPGTNVSGPIARQFAAAQAADSKGNDPGLDAISPPAASMAETLRDAFSPADEFAGTTSGAGNPPDFIRAVYQRMQAWGL